MTSLGHYALFIAHGLAIWGLVASLVAYKTRDERYLDSVIRALYGICGLVVFSTVTLWIALLRDDFGVKYVWEYSRRSQPWIYKLTALWGGMSGSMLFWCLLLAIFSAMAVSLNRKNNLKLLPFTSFLLLLTLGFFLFMLCFKMSPFEPLKDAAGQLVSSYPASAMARVDGNGMNPLLQNIYMAIHPPMLYLGYVGFAIPFAFILGALAHRERNTFWMKSARNWAMFSWLTLGIGILLGGYWAYIELGWGGYWAWDPVENASFMPWLTGTAFLHSFLMQEKRGIYRFWNVSFIVTTFLLSIYGTYLTRSGILQSVHAFGQEDPSIPWYLRIGTIFLGFMAMMFIVSAVFVWRRRDLLLSGQKNESASSRETLFLYSNLLFALFTFVVVFGVTSPIFYRMITHKELSHGPEYYNPRILPVSLAILLVMGLASVAPWRRGGWESYKRQLAIPFVAALSAIAVSFAAFFSGGALSTSDFASRPLTYVYLFACVGLSFFVSAVILEEYVRTVRHALGRGLTRLPALTAPFQENPRRYGGYMVHIGVVCLFLGIAFSSTFQTQYQESMKPGDEVRFGPYAVRMEKLQHDDLDGDFSKVNEKRIWADLTVYRGEKMVAYLQPMRVFYASNPEQPTYEVAIHSQPMRDFYTLLAGYDLNSDTAIIGVFVNPMVAWLWLGSFLILVGGLTALVPMRRV